MSQTPGSRKSPHFNNLQEDPDTVTMAEEHDTLQLNMEQLDVNAQVYTPHQQRDHR